MVSQHFIYFLIFLDKLSPQIIVLLLKFFFSSFSSLVSIVEVSDLSILDSNGIFHGSVLFFEDTGSGGKIIDFRLKSCDSHFIV